MVSLHLCALIRVCLESVGTDSRYVTRSTKSKIKVSETVF